MNYLPKNKKNNILPLSSRVVLHPAIFNFSKVIGKYRQSSTTHSLSNNDQPIFKLRNLSLSIF